MPLFQSFRNLSPKARIGVGVGLLVWGVVGLQLSDRAEERYFNATEEERDALRRMGPRITTLDREDDQNQNQNQNSGSSGSGTSSGGHMN